MNLAHLRLLHRYLILSITLMIVLSACGGTQQPTQTPAFVPTVIQPTPAPDCTDAKKGENVARQFFVALNTYNVDAAIALLSPDIQLYADGVTGFFEEHQNLVNIRAYLSKQAGVHDQFVITTVVARIDPSPKNIEFYVEIRDVVRVNDDLSAKKKVAKGTITMSVHCDTLKISIIGLSVRPVAQ